jgi:hypothetical protein
MITIAPNLHYDQPYVVKATAGSVLAQVGHGFMLDGPGFFTDNSGTIDGITTIAPSGVINSAVDGGNFFNTWNAPNSGASAYYKSNGSFKTLTNEYRRVQAFITPDYTNIRGEHVSISEVVKGILKQFGFPGTAWLGGYDPFNDVLYNFTQINNGVGYVLRCSGNSFGLVKSNRTKFDAFLFGNGDIEYYDSNVGGYLWAPSGYVAYSNAFNILVTDTWYSGYASILDLNNNNTRFVGFGANAGANPHFVIFGRMFAGWSCLGVDYNNNNQLFYTEDFINFYPVHDKNNVVNFANVIAPGNSGGQLRNISGGSCLFGGYCYIYNIISPTTGGLFPDNAIQYSTYGLQLVSGPSKRPNKSKVVRCGCKS